MNNKYTAENIIVLEGLDPVRRRPGMYIGSTGSSGLHHLVYEVIDNAIDEAMAGFANNIEIEFLDDNVVKVADNGRGIPIEIHPQTKVSALQTVMTVLHAGAKFDGKSYKISGGLHGVGVSVVNALSEWTRAEICREGKKYAQEYKRGVPVKDVEEQGACDKIGTTITFKPDNTIFKGEQGEHIVFSLKIILEHLRRQAYLTPGVLIKVLDKRIDRYADSKLPFKYNFYFEGGIIAYVRAINRGKTVDHQNIFFISQNKLDQRVEVSFQYANDLEGVSLSFANNISTPSGGSHLTGFKSALTRVLNKYAENNNFFSKEDERLTGEDVQEGLTSIVSVKLIDPQFEGQTKSKLGNADTRGIVEGIVTEALEEFLKRNTEDAGIIIRKVILSQKARTKARAVKQIILRKGALSGLRLPGKLTDCSSKIAEDSEIFIVEGDSAGGSAKQGRNPAFQAILPIRGKILNIEKARLNKILDSKEIQAIVVALGTAIADEFNLEKLRYHKIIIMADADSDGLHIATLLLTLFFRHFKELIDNGYLYIANPPLYKIQKGKTIKYAYSDEEKDAVFLEIDKEGKADIQRYKGLGEMNPKQLWETTMDPEHRILKRISIEDAALADKMFDILMGDEVKPRRKFIQSHSRDVDNLDI